MTLKTKISEILNSDVGKQACKYLIHEYNASRVELLTEFHTELVSNDINLSIVDSYGGEGEGEQYWAVYEFSLRDETVYVQFDGFYSSYNGAEFQEWFFVEPLPVQKIDWVAISS